MATKQLTAAQAMMLSKYVENYQQDKECCAEAAIRLAEEQKTEIERLKSVLRLIQKQTSWHRAIGIACEALGDPPPMSPADFMDALQDRVHREVGKSRPGRSSKASKAPQP